MALSLATRHPDRVGVVVPVAAGLGVTSLQVVHNFEQITAITSDPAFAGGEYGAEPPAAGLALARMIGHKTFVSLSAMRTRAREEIVEGAVHGYRLRHPLESYMRHQGTKFVDRFDANSYLRIMEAWQSVDLLAEAGAADWDTLFGRCRRQRVGAVLHRFGRVLLPGGTGRPRRRPVRRRGPQPRDRGRLGQAATTPSWSRRTGSPHGLRATLEGDW